MTKEAKREAWWWLRARTEAAARWTGIVSGHAVVWTEPGRAELLPIEVPSAGRGEVTLQVLASVVSPGTERAQYLHLQNTRVKYPHPVGFSGGGIVVAVGSDVSHVRPGDRAVAASIPHASVVTVPAKRVYPVPAGVPLEEAAAVALGVIAEQGVRLAQIATGEPVCILGAGLIGALTLRIARAAGAGELTVIATSRRGESGARRGGAEHFLVAGEELQDIARLSAPVVIDATGDPEGLPVAVSAAGESGRVVLLGSPRGRTGALPVDELRRKRLTLVGAHSTMIDRESGILGVDLRKLLAEEFLERLASRRLEISDLLEGALNPREADAFYRALARGELTGGWFDWSRLSSAERARPGHLFRRPDLSARGVDYRMKPKPAASFDGVTADPFAGATGHLRIGLLGCGDVAVYNAAAIAAAPNTELVACYDPVAELAQELAGRYGGETARSADELIERNDVDAVFLSVPHHLHAPLAIQAAAYGRHVIVEKPPANDLSAAIEMVHAAERGGVRLTVHFPVRHEPQVAAAKRLIEAGALGEVKGVIVRLLMDRPPSYWLGGFSGRSTSDWRSSRGKAGGGVLIMNLSHYIDLVRYLVGVEADSVLAATASEDSAEVEETISVTVNYSNGAVGSMFGSTSVRGTGGGAPELELWGSDGNLLVGSKHPQIWTLRALDGLRASCWHELDRLPQVDMRAVFVSRFASAVHRGEPPEVGGAEALAVQAFIEAAYRSSELGQLVRPADVLAEAGL